MVVVLVISVSMVFALVIVVIVVVVFMSGFFFLTGRLARQCARKFRSRGCAQYALTHIYTYQWFMSY